MILLANAETVAFALVAVIAVAIFILLRRSSRRVPRRRGKDDRLIEKTPRPRRAEHAHHLGAPPELVQWEVQMQEVARELSAQLDSKMSALQALIADADRAAARLEAAKAGTSDEPSEPAGDAPQQRDRIHTLADYGFAAADIASRVGCPVGQIEQILGERKGAGLVSAKHAAGRSSK